MNSYKVFFMVGNAIKGSKELDAVDDQAAADIISQDLRGKVKGTLAELWCGNRRVTNLYRDNP